MNRTAIKTVTHLELRELTQKQPIELIDVRTPEEFAEAHVPGAVNVPLDTLNPIDIAEGRADDADNPIYIICEVGGRSAHACIAFMMTGYPHVVNVAGGTAAWREAGFPVDQGN